MRVVKRPSPNFDSREGQAIDLIIIHYTDMQSSEEALMRLSDPFAEVSAHYLICRDGEVFQLVDEKHRAWHAGVSQWPDLDGVMQTNINARSIGIELDNPGHSHGYVPFVEPQMQSLIELLHDVCRRNAIPPHRIVGHEDIAPDRKCDPGELFDWQLLKAHGLGKRL